MKMITTLALALLLSGCGSTQNNAASRAADQISAPGLASHIKTLASDEFGGRAPGSEGETLTVNYLVEQFKQIGLAPANNGSYTQAVPLTSVEVTNAPTLHFSAKNGQKLSLSYPEQQVVWTRKQLSHSEIDHSQLVFVGYGINAPERQWNDYAGVDVRGKTVVILINDPGYATQDPQLFNGNAMTYYGRWDYKFDEAARQGAAGAIIIHDTKPAAYPWSTVSASWTGPQFDLVRPNRGADLVDIESWIGRSHAQTLFAQAGLNLDSLYKAAATPGFKAIPMDVTASTKVSNTIKQLDSQNVAALIKGSENPEDVFIYMAHWDHIGTDPTKANDGIYNGALDNATGTGGLLELAKAYAALPQAPKRSVMFLAITAEEQGLLGSAYYAANPIFPLANTIAGLNMDGLSNFGRANNITLISKGFSQLDGYFERQAKLQNRRVSADPKPEKGGFFRSDHFELSKMGVPTLYPSPGYDHHKHGLKHGLAQAVKYTANDYHRPSDEYNDSWDLSGAVQDLQLFFATGLEIIQSGDWPQWNKGSQFEAKRKEQMKDK